MARKAGHFELNLSHGAGTPRTMGPWGSEVAWLRVHRNTTIAPTMTHFQPIALDRPKDVLALFSATGELHTTLLAASVKAETKDAMK